MEQNNEDNYIGILNEILKDQFSREEGKIESINQFSDFNFVLGIISKL